MARSTAPVRVLRLRIKDKHAFGLCLMAREVNFVWNYCNELSLKIFHRERRFASGIELQRYLNGASKEASSFLQKPHTDHEPGMVYR
jgi:hypothetical protein